MLVIIIIGSSLSYAKYVIDCSKIAVNLEIDRTKPVGEVKYSTKEITNGDVIATINLSEPILEVDGWELSEDGLTLTKTYDANFTETIKIIDLSGNENTVDINIQNIDKTPPVIEIINIQNTNVGYENYANKTHKVTATIKITDMEINSNIDITNISVLVGEYKNICAKTLKNLTKTRTQITFDLELEQLEDNGSLELFIPDGFVTDVAGNSSKQTMLKTGITIDNIAPTANYSQEILQSGKVRAYATGNEGLRHLDKWNLSEDKRVLSKDFPANVSYFVTITDFAQNTSEVEINITGATYIVLTYASHNSEVGWTYGYGNYNIAGKEAINKNPKYKTEALAFRITGGVDSNFVKVRGYVYSHWNYLSDYGRCQRTGYKYKLRGAPTSNGGSYYTMGQAELSTIEGMQYIQLGGSGINGINCVDYDGNNPIPYDALYDNSGGIYPYGVSGLEIALADYSELSVVYQILVNGVGWLDAQYNGRMTMQAQNKPMSAIRVAIIPNSELESLLELWNKDTGTYNMK